MSKIYRVQDAEGRGPWKPGFSQVWATDRPESEIAKLIPIQQDFPNLRQIIENNAGKHFGVGCTSLPQLRHWITEAEYATLLKHGYQCVSLAAEIIAMSDIQCVFCRHRPLFKNVKKVRLYGWN